MALERFKTHSKLFLLVPILLTLWSTGLCARCASDEDALANDALANGSLTETFESPQGTDNEYEVKLSSGNSLGTYYWASNLSPPLWGEHSGRVVVGPDFGGAFWMKRNTHASPTGYEFTASFMITSDGTLQNQGITLFVSKPTNWQGPLAAWRLYFYKDQGQLNLTLVTGLNTRLNNPSGRVYTFPINVSQPYNVAITYDTKRRFYMWVVDGQTLAAADMPCDYPLVATHIIGSSGSSGGRNSTFLVDNVRWYELPK